MTTTNKLENMVLRMVEIAVKKRDVELVRQFLDLEPDLNNSEYSGRILWNALDDLTISMMLVRAGAKLNMINAETNTNKYRFLHRIVDFIEDEKYLQLAKVMMDRGAEIEAHDANGETPLHLAVKICSVTFIKELLRRGADVEAPNRELVNAIQIAINVIRDGHAQADVLLPLLIKGDGPNQDTLTRRWILAFRYCLYNFNNFTEPMKVLTNFGIPLVTLDDGEECQGNIAHWPNHLCMPLNYATYARHMITMEFLLNNGADINKQSKCGVSPLAMALFRDDASIIKFVIQQGADIHKRNERDGRYPIHIACELRSVHNLKLLLNLGADINVTDKNGLTPLHFAALERRFDLTYRTVIKEIALLVSKNVEVNDNDLSIIHLDPDTNAYFEKCSEQLKLMRETELCDNVKAYDLFMLSTEEIMLLIKKQGFLDNFNKTKSMFQEYSENAGNKIKLADKVKSSTHEFYFSVYDEEYI